jgi:hypothetical protein
VAGRGERLAEPPSLAWNRDDALQHMLVRKVFRRDIARPPSGPAAGQGCYIQHGDARRLVPPRECALGCPYADAENCGNSVASLEIVAAVAASSSASGLRGVPAGNPRALSAVLMAGMNGADMIASISG